MCKKSILENGGTLKFSLDCYKYQEIRNKAVHNYPPALELVPEWFMTQEMCDRVVNTLSSVMKFVPECYKTQSNVW